MKIKDGKFYRTRKGMKIGPMERPYAYPCSDYAWRGKRDGHSNSTVWYRGEDGRFGSGEFEDPNDLVVECPESPVRTVTRKEIVGGVYGRLYVAKQGGEKPRILVNLADQNGDHSMGVSHGWSVAELRAAIATLTEIADALEEAG